MRGVGRFLSDEQGAVTIEFTILVPVFILMLVLFADASLIYQTHSEMFNVARDIARRMSTEQIKTPEEVRNYAAEHLFLGQRTYIVDPDFGGEMRVTIVTGLDNATIFGFFFRPILGRELLASAAMRREPMN